MRRLVALLIALTIVAVATPTLADSLTLNRVVFTGIVEDIVPGAVLVETLAGGTLVPTNAAQLLVGNKAVSAASLSVGKPVTVALPRETATLVAVADGRAVMMLPQGPIAVPLSALGPNESTVSVAMTNQPTQTVPFSHAMSLAAQGARVPATLGAAVERPPGGTTYGVVFGKYGNQILVQTSETNHVLLRGIPLARAGELVSMSGKAVVIMPSVNGFTAADWQPGTNAHVSFNGTVEKVTGDTVYVKTQWGTVLVPKKDICAPTANAASPTYSGATYNGGSRSYTASNNYSDVGYADNSYASSAYASTETADYYPTADYPPPVYDNGYPSYAYGPPAYAYPYAYPAFAPGFAAAVNLSPGLAIGVSIPTCDVALEGFCGSTALFAGPVGYCSVPVAALPPCYACTPVLMPYGGGCFPCPLGTALSLQLGDVNLSFFQGAGYGYGYAVPPYYFGGPALWGAPGPAYYPQTLVLTDPLPVAVAATPTVVSLANGEVITAPFGRAASLVAMHNAMIVDPPAFPAAARGLRAGVVTANGSIMSMPLRDAVAMHRAQRLTFADNLARDPAFRAQDAHTRVDVRLRNGNTVNVPLTSAMNMQRAQGATILSNPTLSSDLANRKVRMQMANGTSVHMRMQDALNQQQAHAQIASRHDFVAAGTGHSRVGIQMNGHNFQVPMQRAMHLQSIGAATIQNNSVAVPSSHGGLSGQAVAMGRVGDQTLFQSSNHGRVQLQTVPTSRLAGVAPAPGHSVVLRPGTNNKLAVVPTHPAPLASGNHRATHLSTLHPSAQSTLRQGLRTSAGPAHAVQQRTAVVGNQQHSPNASRPVPQHAMAHNARPQSRPAVPSHGGTQAAAHNAYYHNPMRPAYHPSGPTARTSYHAAPRTSYRAPAPRASYRAPAPRASYRAPAPRIAAPPRASYRAPAPPPRMAAPPRISAPPPRTAAPAPRAAPAPQPRRR